VHRERPGHSRGRRDLARESGRRDEYFEKIRPTRTTVGVVALPVPISIELKVIAEG